eukprot:COSAG02_NODE_1300_length_13379_cov_18.739121_5_plen_236_part_00
MSDKSDASTCTKVQNGFLNLVNPKFKNFSRPMLLALPVFVVGAIAFIYQLDKGVNNNSVAVRFLKTEGRCFKPGLVPDAPSDLAKYECVAMYQTVSDGSPGECYYNPDIIGGAALDVPLCPDSYYQVDPVDGTEVTGFPRNTAEDLLPTDECAGYDNGNEKCYYYGVSPIDISGEIGTAFAFMGTVEVVFTTVWIAVLWCSGCIKSNSGQSFKNAVQDATSGETMGDKGEEQAEA